MVICTLNTSLWSCFDLDKLLMHLGSVMIIPSYDLVERLPLYGFYDHDRYISRDLFIWL